MWNLPLEQTFDSFAWLVKIEKKKHQEQTKYFQFLVNSKLLDFIDTESQTENYMKKITVFFRRNDEEKV